MMIFYMDNAPDDEDDVRNVVEGALNVEVAEVEYVNSDRTTAFISLTEEIALQDIIDKVNALYKSDGFEILPCSSDELFVTNLDEEFMTPDLLQRYLESTYADGYRVISDCRPLMGMEKAYILRFTNESVMSAVVKNRDHHPLKWAIPDYCIRIKPFYKAMEKPSFPEENLPDPKDCHLPAHTASISHDADIGDENKRVLTSKCSELADHVIVAAVTTPVDVVRSDDEKDYDSVAALTTPLDVVKSEDEEDYDSATEGKQNVAAPDVDVDVAVTTSTAVADEVEENERVNLPEVEWRLLEEKIRQQVSSNPDYNKKEQILGLKGKSASDDKRKVIELRKEVNKDQFEMSEDMLNLYCQRKVKEMVENRVKHMADFECAVNEDTKTLFAYSLGSVDVYFKELKDICFYKITEKSNVPDHVITECHRDINEKQYVARFSWNESTSEYTIIGFKEDVYEIKGFLDRKQKDYEIVERSFILTDNEKSYTEKWAKEKFQDLLKETEFKKEEKSKSEVVYKIQCEKVKWEKLKNDLTQFKSTISTHKNVTFNDYGDKQKALICKNMETDSEVLLDFENRNICVVCVDYEGSNNNNNIECTIHNEGSKTYKVNPALSVEVCSKGEITKEPSKLLVCGVKESHNLNGTAVGKSCLRADPTLQDRINDWTFSPNGVVINVNTLPGTQCEAMAFVELQKWNTDKSDDNNHLLNAITEVLEKANETNLTSISFPPLGPGKAFNYPKEVFAQTIIKAISNFSQKMSDSCIVNHIRLLAPEASLFSELCNKVEESFPNSHDTDQGAGCQDPLLGFNEKSEERIKTLLQQKLPVVTIVNGKAEDNSVVVRFKKYIEDVWLYEESCQVPPYVMCDPAFVAAIMQESEKLGVLIFQQDPKIVKLSFTGKPKDVQKMSTFVSKEASKIRQPPQTLFGVRNLKRGTLEFIKHALSFEDFPKYWNQTDEDYSCVSINTETKAAISQLIEKTWEKDNVGKGNDAEGITKNSQVKVIDIKRIENRPLFYSYVLHRKKILKHMLVRKRICPDVGKVGKSNGPIVAAQHLIKLTENNLIDEVNEVYLLHGSSLCDTISKQGFETRFGNQVAMYGQGIYMAEKSTKADQYSDPRKARVPNGTSLNMLLVRATLGEIFLVDETHPSVQDKNSIKLKRPPCVKCETDQCKTCYDYDHYHSVMGQVKGKLYREFITYDSNLVYPEYLITYQRV